VTRPSPKPSTLTGDQRRAIDRARKLATAAERGSGAVAELLGCASESGTVYPYAFGSAMAQMRDLLAILDELAPAQPASGTSGGTR
jgi:hypothetical protein